MNKKYNKLFEKIKIRDLILKNRIIMAPMATRYATYNGFVTDRMINYYKERAKGGAGLITIEAAAVSSDGIGWPDNLRIDDDIYIEGLKKLVAEIHNAGAKVSQEIFHSGRKAPAEIIGKQPIGPSAVGTFNGKVPREATIEEIEQLILKFGQGAKRAKLAGYDAVNIHMAHGYIINQFLSPLSNRRTDMYGGNTEGRVKLAVRIISEVRKQVGDEFPIFCRLTADEGEKVGGLDLNESLKIAPYLEQAGADVIDISAGTSESPYLVEQTMSMDEGCLVYLAEGIKKVVNVPVSVVGKITNPELAEKIINDGKADMIVMGRALIADPYLPVKAEQGRDEDIRPCISCKQACAGRLGKSLEISCLVNPSCGREEMFKETTVEKVKKIMVIGSGVAGLNAALELAIKGHNVSIFEKKDKIGGQSSYASTPKHKLSINKLIMFYKTQLDKNNVKINLNTEVNENVVKDFSPDAIIIACGASPRKLNIPGMESINVMTAWEVLEKKECPGERVVVLGGGEVGLETSEYIINMGKKVYILEVQSDIGRDMDVWEKTFLLDRISKSQLEIITQAKVLKIDNGNIYFDRGGLIEVVKDVDTIVFSVGAVKNNIDFLNVTDIPLYKIGDCVEPRRMCEAIGEGYMLKFEKNM